jgi:dienelactone hydrolase
MLGACLILALLSVQVVEKGEATFRPTPAESAVPELFRLAESKFGFELEPVLDSPAYSVAKLRFPSPIVTPEESNNTVHCEYFRPKGPGRRPAVVVLHILGADFALSRYYAARLADRGVAALFLKLPYYGERRPAGGPQRFLSNDVGRSTTSMRQGICDIRRAAGWLAGRPEVDPGKLGVTGISLGGITSALAAAVDPTLNRGVFLLAGGGLDEILWGMDEPDARRARQLWIDTGHTRADLKALTTPFDPLTYADRLVGKKVLMMAANVDEVVPPSAAKALWAASGRPPIRWFDCGHYSALGYLLPALRESVEFFAAEVPR